MKDLGWGEEEVERRAADIERAQDFAVRGSFCFMVDPHLRTGNRVISRSERFRDLKQMEGIECACG